MDITDFIRQVAQLEKEQDAIYRSVAAKYGLSDSAMWILYMITDTEEPCTQQDLCHQSCFPKQTINSAVNRMIKEGYAVLETIPGTRNQKKVLLTKEGKALAGRTVNCLREAEKKAYGKLTAKEREAFLTATQKITESLREETQKL